MIVIRHIEHTMPPASHPGDNPFAPPLTAGDAALPPPDLRPILYQWEKMRLVYNGVLGVWVLLLGSLTLGSLTLGEVPLTPSLLEELVLCAVIANLCYFAGPLLDVYAAVFLRTQVRMIKVLFPLGTVLAMLLAVVYWVGFAGAAAGT